MNDRQPKIITIVKLSGIFNHAAGGADGSKAR
jgi:hypothetical protein